MHLRKKETSPFHFHTALRSDFSSEPKNKADAQRLVFPGPYLLICSVRGCQTQQPCGGESWLRSEACSDAQIILRLGGNHSGGRHSGDLGMKQCSTLGMLREGGIVLAQRKTLAPYSLHWTRRCYYLDTFLHPASRDPEP